MLQKGFDYVTEVPLGGAAPAWIHAGWASRFPWLLQATTHRGDADFDLRFHGGETGALGESRLSGLAEAEGFSSQVLSRQVHGGKVLSHMGRRKGLSIAADADGHVTNEEGMLLAVTVADCVPVFVVDAEVRAIALLHAGWRSAAAGILAAGFARLSSDYGTRVQDVLVHLGPSICGECYEVGPEVFRALGQTEPDRPQSIDLRGVLARQAADLGVQIPNISLSTHCTLCGSSPFYSHRGGDHGRQLALLGIRRAESDRNEPRA